MSMPKPAIVREIEGNPSHRPLARRKEPRPDVKAPPCPAHLDARAKREWKRLVRVLTEMRVLAEADQIQLANLCQTYSILAQAHEELAKSGIMVDGKPSSMLKIINQSTETINRLSREFGLTPAARVRLNAVDPIDQKFNSIEAALCG